MVNKSHNWYQEFETLIENHNREIFVFIWRMLPTTEEAEDCLQDTFLKAYKAYPRLNNHDNLRAWLYKIASNTANTRLKKISLEQKRTIDEIDLFTTNEKSTHQNVENSLLMEEVKIAINLLPQKQRSALILKNFQHFNYPEIALILNISEESARANVYQAMKKLRNQFRNRTPENV
ncbi:MAG: RNA polymerase sigma factor [Chloroflexi bacterium]|nr:RNA polymerase sigma factor [Chloroflexota bacterium]MBT3670844.1 RNA polymerase sigma factor [Chloroflexota bacterium]MBT4305303.1 RNA polymerase sigma factor [Chloroflexota bacterium]MBT4532449.1 RNA polymerase sigma factor [Chloroflexota bacterium]MBT4683110.1 RNA polymerase sigma factor [Chloroflexota bacterium]